MLTGLFANGAINPLIKDTYKVADKAVSLEGSMGQFVNQAIAAGITIVISIVLTFVILKIIDVVMGLRVSEDEEAQGLDISMHGEEAYSNDHGSTSSIEPSHAHSALGGSAVLAQSKA